MERKNKKNLQNLIFKIITYIIIFIGAFLIGYSATLFSGKEKIAISKILIVQKGYFDSYTLVKSQEVISEVLKEVMHSYSFIKKVYASNFDIKDIPKGGPKEIIKFFSKKVKISTSSLTGSIVIKTKAKDKLEALKLNSAIIFTIKEGIKRFYGNPKSFELVIIDYPYVIEKYKGFGLLVNSLIVGILFVALVYIIEKKLAKF